MAQSQSESPLSSTSHYKEGPGSHERIRQGKQNSAWPGQNTIVFRQCEERSDEAISRRAA